MSVIVCSVFKADPDRSRALFMADRVAIRDELASAATANGTGGDKLSRDN